MLWKERPVVFAEEKLETDFRRLGESKHPEDECLHSILTGIRAELGKRWGSGRRVTGRATLTEYKRMDGVSNLWVLKLHRHGTVIYSVSRSRIQILDIL